VCMRVVTMNFSNNQKEDEWLNFKDKLAKIKDSVDPRYLLESLGFSGFTRDTAKELRSPCLIHGGDNTTAFRLNRDTNTWVCFTNKCHETYGNDLVALIQGVLKVDFMSAVNYLKELCGEAGGENITEFKRKKEKESFINRYKTSKIGSNIVTESQLEQFKFFRSDFFLNQGFTKDVLDYFEIAGGYKDKFSVKRDIIPIRDAKGSLVAYGLRDVSSDDPELKYILTDGFDKNNVLYNLHNIDVSKPIIVVEGFKSVWRLKQYGIDNVVAVIGSEVTIGQQLFIVWLRSIRCRYLV